MIVVLGDVMTDVVAVLREPLAIGSDAAAEITTGGGGSAANTAAWLAAAGAAATLVGRVGNDAAGRERLAELAAAGVHLAVTVDHDRRTGACLVLVSPDGERTMVPDRAANLALAVADVPDVSAAHVHVSGYALLDDGPRAAAVHAMASARSVSVDAASAAPLAAVGPERFAAEVGGALLLANAEEAALLPDAGDVVVKRGAAGAEWRRDGRVVARVTAPVVPVVDTTGAGDAFAAGLLAARLAGAGEEAALTAGAALAARCVTTVGGRPR